jgi:glycerate dehydrogenase
VDEAALARALLEGVDRRRRLRRTEQGAAIARQPLLALRLPNFILTPHVAWASSGAGRDADAGRHARIDNPLQSSRDVE